MEPNIATTENRQRFDNASAATTLEQVSLIPTKKGTMRHHQLRFFAVMSKVAKPLNYFRSGALVCLMSRVLAGAEETRPARTGVAP